MTQWQLGGSDPPSIWARPTTVGVLGAVVYVVLAVVNLPADTPGSASLAIVGGAALNGFLVGFFAAVILLTYARVVDRSD